MKPMKKEIQDALRKQPKTTKPAPRIAREVKGKKGQKAAKPAAKGKEK